MKLSVFISDDVTPTTKNYYNRPFEMSLNSLRKDTWVRTNKVGFLFFLFEMDLPVAL